MTFLHIVLFSTNAAALLEVYYPLFPSPKAPQEPKKKWTLDFMPSTYWRVWTRNAKATFTLDTLSIPTEDFDNTMES